MLLGNLYLWNPCEYEIDDWCGEETEKVTSRGTPFFRERDNNELIWADVIFILNEYLRDKYQGKDNVYNGKSPYDILGKKTVTWLCGLYGKWINFDASNIEMFIDAESKLSDSDVEKLVDLCKAWVWFRTCEDIVRSVRLSDGHFQKVVILSSNFWIIFDCWEDIEKYKVFFDKLDLSDIGFLRLIDLCWSVTEEDIENFHKLWKIPNEDEKDDAVRLYMLGETPKKLLLQYIEEAENWDQFKSLLSDFYDKMLRNCGLNGARISTNIGNFSLLSKGITDARIDRISAVKSIQLQYLEMIRLLLTDYNKFGSLSNIVDNPCSLQATCDQLFELLEKSQVDIDEMKNQIRGISSLLHAENDYCLKSNALIREKSVMRQQNYECYIIEYFYTKFVVGKGVTID